MASEIEQVESASSIEAPGQLADGDLEKMARDYAEYLTVNCRQEKKQLDERIQSIAFRVEEFQRQLEWMYQNVTSTSEKVLELHLYMENFIELFEKIDQIEAFIQIVNSNVDQLELAVGKAERDLEPSKLRKVMSVLPGMRKSQAKDTAGPGFTAPELFSTKDYFMSKSIGMEPPSAAPSSSQTLPDQSDDQPND